MRRPARLDILVNNAGVVPTGPLLEASVADWRKVMAIDVDGVFFCTVEAHVPVAAEPRYGRDVDDVAAAPDQVRQGGARAEKHVLVQTGDVSDQGDAEALIAAAVERFGRLDILVNNAGVVPTGPLPVTRSSFSRVRPLSTTDAPSCAKRRAVAAPMPEPDPVTILLRRGRPLMALRSRTNAASPG
jgi:NAD(P)-dependent dehydrogenase (short-subunit alcohol dehydrogenase family)